MLGGVGLWYVLTGKLGRAWVYAWWCAWGCVVMMWWGGGLSNVVFKFDQRDVNLAEPESKKPKQFPIAQTSPTHTRSHKIFAFSSFFLCFKTVFISFSVATFYTFFDLTFPSPGRDVRTGSYYS